MLPSVCHLLSSLEQQKLRLTRDLQMHHTEQAAINSASLDTPAGTSSLCPSCLSDCSSASGQGEGADEEGPEGQR